MHDVGPNIPGPFALLETSLPSLSMTALSYSLTICNFTVKVPFVYVRVRAKFVLTFTLQMREMGNKKMMSRNEKKARM